MKRMFFFGIAMMILGTQVFGQKQQTLVSGEISNGGYGGPVLKMVTLNGTNGVMVGGRGGWIINHMLVLGGGGYGLASDIRTPSDSLLNFGYGGLALEYIIKSDNLIHFSVETLIGSGGISQHERNHPVGVVMQNDEFFIIEPGVNVELNMTSFFRIGAGFSYRLTNGISSWGLSDSDFSGYGANLTFKFGSF